MSARHRVCVHAQHLRAGEQLLQLLLHPLCAETDMLQRTAALRTLLRRPLGVAAIVAHQPVIGAVVGEIHAAPGTFRHIAALGAQQLAAAAPAVEEQNALLPGGHILLQLLLQGTADDGAVSAAQLLPQVGQHHLRQRLAVVPLRQLQQVIVPLPRVVKRLHRGRGRAQKQPRTLGGAAVFGHVAGVVARRVFRLVRPFLLLVHNDQSQLVQRREHRRPGTQHDVRLAPAQPLVLVVPLRQAQSAVEQRHLVAEIGGEARHHLRRQGDLRHQDHHGLAHPQQLLRQPDIHHRLAAAGNAPQQRDPRFTALYLPQQRVTDPLLPLIQC